MDAAFLLSSKASIDLGLSMARAASRAPSGQFRALKSSGRGNPPNRARLQIEPAWMRGPRGWR